VRRGRRATRSEGLRRSGARRFLWRMLMTGGLLAAFLVGGRILLRLLPVSGTDVPAVILEEGTVAITVPAEGIVVRQETVVRAPAPGVVQRLVAEGERVRAGTPVVTLLPEPGAVAAPCSGIVVYQVDGLEGVLVPETVVQSGPGLLSELSVQGPAPTGSGEVSEGTPLFKVVDNLSVGLAVAVPANKAALLHEGEWVSLQVGWEAEPRRARVRIGAQEGEQVLLYLTHLERPDDLVLRRRVRVTLVIREYTGKVVPRSAVDVQDGLQGIWIQQRGQPVFHPVRVIGGNESEVVVETDLPRGTRVFPSPPQASP